MTSDLPPQPDLPPESPPGVPSEPPPEPAPSPAPRRLGWLRSSDPDDPHAQRMLLAVFWCGYLLISWGVIQQIYGAGGTARPMILAILLGSMLLWPAWRLSQRLPRRIAPPDSTELNRFERLRVLLYVFHDWISLNLLLLVVIWALQWRGEWEPAQTSWLLGALAAWTLVIGAVLAWGLQGTQPLRRTSAMLCGVLLLLGPPVLNLPPAFSPLATAWLLTDKPVNYVPGRGSQEVLTAGVLGLLIWFSLLLSAWRERRS